MMQAMQIPESVIVHGIPNCDSVKKARAWLDAQGIIYTFHDFKKQGVPPERLDHWLRDCGRDRLVNRKGTTWRKLDPALQAQASDDVGARALMLGQPSVIKRPVIEWGSGSRVRVTVGFDPDAYAGVLA
jgi:arsenate reductase (glutaredoxin)